MAKTINIQTYIYSARETAGITLLYGDGYGHVGVESGYGIVETSVYGNVPAYNILGGLSGEAQIQSVVLTVELNGDPGHTAYAGVLQQYLLGKSYQQQYSIISSAPKTWTLNTGATSEIRITDPDTIRQVLQYGIGINPGSGGNWKSRPFVDIAVTYSDPNEPPELTEVKAPSTVYTSDDITLQWTYSQSADLAQTAVDVQLITADGVMAYSVAEKASVQDGKITVNLRGISSPLITSEKHVFRVRAYTKNNTLVSKWEKTPAFTLRNIAVEIVSPKNGENKLASAVNRMRWKKAADDTSQNAPAAFSVSYSVDAGESWVSLLGKGEASSDGEGWYIDVPANTFRHGVVQWLVMAWSTEYQPGESAKTSFYSVVQASSSGLRCDGKPIPTISWESSSQVAYQVRFADYDSGAVFGTAKSHRVPYVYDTGIYEAQVRTQASTGQWSEWTPVEYVQVTNIPPNSKINFVVQKTRRASTFKWRVSPTSEETVEFEAFVLYRDDVPIYVGTDNVYTDLYASGPHRYYVRGVTKEGYFLQSVADTGQLDVSPDEDCLYDIDGQKFVSMKFSSEPKRRQYRVNKVMSMRYYAGRTKPVAYTEGYMERSATYTCTTQSIEEARTLEAIAGKEVIAKSKSGTSIRGILNNVSRVEGTMHEMMFTVTETDWEEKVPYEVT